MQQLLWIGLAGALGALSRHGLGLAANRAVDWGIPAGTLAVNVLGSIALGFLMEGCDRAGWSAELRLALGTGFLGSFTTFSTFSVETIRLVESGNYGAVAANIGANLVLALAGAALGIWVARMALGEPAV